MTTAAHTPLTMLVCCHKADVMATQAPYLPIQVGKALAPADLGIQGDNTGNNISLKNPSYCELTGMYWAWKNLNPQPPLIGLCHYRRYFDFHHQCRPLLDIQAFKTKQFNSIDLSVPKSVTDNIKNGHAVVAKKKYYMTNLQADYCKCHISDDLRTLEDILEESYPAFLPSYNKVMINNCGIIHYNMFIMTWHDFDEYCRWIFPLLAKVESRTNISNYSPFQRRVFGYLAERLFNIYLHARRFKLHYHNVIWFNDNTKNPTTFQKIETNLRAWAVMEITKQRRKQKK